MKVPKKAKKGIREIRKIPVNNCREKEEILLLENLKEKSKMPTPENHLIKLLQSATPNRM